MSPQDFIQKIEQGNLTDDEMKMFLESISQKLTDLKQRDPIIYLKTLTALSDAMDSVSEGIEAAT